MESLVIRIVLSLCICLLARICDIIKNQLVVKTIFAAYLCLKYPTRLIFLLTKAISDDHTIIACLFCRVSHFFHLTINYNYYIVFYLAKHLILTITTLYYHPSVASNLTLTK